MLPQLYPPTWWPADWPDDSKMWERFATYMNDIKGLPYVLTCRLVRTHLEAPWKVRERSIFTYKEHREPWRVWGTDDPFWGVLGTTEIFADFSVTEASVAIIGWRFWMYGLPGTTLVGKRTIKHQGGLTGLRPSGDHEPFILYVDHFWWPGLPRTVFEITPTNPDWDPTEWLASGD